MCQGALFALCARALSLYPNLQINVKVHRGSDLSVVEKGSPEHHDFAACLLPLCGHTTGGRGHMRCIIPHQHTFRRCVPRPERRVRVRVVYVSDACKLHMQRQILIFPSATTTRVQLVFISLSVNNELNGWYNMNGIYLYLPAGKTSKSTPHTHTSSSASAKTWTKRSPASYPRPLPHRQRHQQPHARRPGSACSP